MVSLGERETLLGILFSVLTHPSGLLFVRRLKADVSALDTSLQKCLHELALEDDEDQDRWGHDEQ